VIHLRIPLDIFLETIDCRNQVETTIEKDLNRISRCSGEFISGVTIEQDEIANILKWREESGALLNLQESETEMANAGERLWIKGYLRAFLSHKAEYKVEASQMKSALMDFGISAFIAHEDIEPTTAWQDEIELALSTQDTCLALLTDQFHDSNWTDQEIGMSIGRGVPIVAIRLGKDPYGFIGKFQAISGANKTTGALAIELVRIFLGNDRLHNRMASALVFRFESAQTFAHANRLMELLKAIKFLPPELIDRLEAAPKANDQVREANEVKRSLATVVSQLRGRVTAQ
jgi:hypothetical protein